MNSNIAVIPTSQIIDTRYTQDVVPILDTSKFEHMQRIAVMMSECAYVPADLLKGNTDNAKIANCFLVVNQAVRWGMDPFALAQTAYFVQGKLGFEGKTIAAAINSDHRLKGRLNYEFSGKGDIMMITVSGTFRDTGETKTITGSVSMWKTSQGLWAKDPEQALVYRGSRQWARRWMPDRLLGIYSSDELDEISARDVPTGQRAARMKDVTPARQQPLLDIPDDVDPPAPAEASQDEATDETLADPAGFLTKLAEDRGFCTSVENVAELRDGNVDLIARLTDADRAKADVILEIEP